MDDSYAVREFGERVLKPAAAAWKDAKPRPEIDQKLAAHMLIEAHGWLRIAVQVGLFKRDIAITLVRPLLSALLDANQLVEAQRIVDTGITDDNRRSLNLDYEFPPLFVEQYPQQFQQFPEGPTVFALWSQEARSFASSQSGTHFVKVLTFEFEKNWVQILSESNSEPFAQDGEVTPGLVEGYLRSLQHLHRIAELFTVEGTPTVEWPARAMMRTEVARIHSWRLNFHAGLFGDRFKEMTVVVANRLTAEAGDAGVALTAQGFIDGVERLKQRYHAVLGYLVSGAEK
jgi:hypothetical protein